MVGRWGRRGRRVNKGEETVGRRRGEEVQVQYMGSWKKGKWGRKERGKNEEKRRGMGTNGMGEYGGW